MMIWVGGLLLSPLGLTQENWKVFLYVNLKTIQYHDFAGEVRDSTSNLCHLQSGTLLRRESEQPFIHGRFIKCSCNLCKRLAGSFLILNPHLIS